LAAEIAGVGIRLHQWVGVVLVFALTICRHWEQEQLRLGRGVAEGHADAQYGWYFRSVRQQP